MKVSEMERLFFSMAESLEQDAEILIEDNEGWLHDFEIEEMEETFDGFETYTPAGLKLKIVDQQ